LSTLSPWHEHLDDNQTSSIRSWSKLGTTESKYPHHLSPPGLYFALRKSGIPAPTEDLQ
jgi:hypothetical protein